MRSSPPSALSLDEPDEPGRDRDGILDEEFYGRPARRGAARVVRVTLDADEARRLDALVAELRRRGQPGADAATVLRHALAALELRRAPRR
jgi:hypothetical protein